MDHGWSVPKNVIVTGGTGFVGSYVCRLLAQHGQSPLAIGIEPFSNETRFVLGDHADRIRYRACDICDPSALDDVCADGAIQAIVHVAGFVGHEPSLAAPARTYAINIGGTVNVLEAARKAGIRKVVIVGSNAAYHTKQRPAFDESHPVTSITAGNPNAHYGTSKMAAEQIGLTYHSYHDMDVLVARITAVYGFPMRGPIFVKPMVEAAVRGETVAIPTGGAFARDYTYVEDSAAGIVAMLNTDTRALEQRVFNISRGQLVSASDIADIVRHVVPGAEVSVGTTLTALEEANVRQRAPLSSDAAKQAFGFVAQYSMEDGIRAYIATLRRYLQDH
jgi:nucleoside-diphosphate-sugar epimerase